MYRLDLDQVDGFFHCDLQLPSVVMYHPISQLFADVQTTANDQHVLGLTLWPECLISKVEQADY